MRTRHDSGGLLWRNRRLVILGLVLGLVGVACGTAEGKVSAGSSTASQVADQRRLNAADQRAAMMTYMPSGRKDDYVTFASGGQSGQIHAIGVPSMRLLRTISVFTPEPWQGYGYGAKSTQDVLDEGKVNDKPVLWGDTHHPALSETKGDYDGQFLFINDKANARMAVVDLRDWETKQIVKNPVGIVDHGGTFVTPGTEYVVEGGQYGTPFGWKYAPLDQYKDQYRGLITFWKFDRQKGRIDPTQSFAMELPPYWQDLCDSGKLVSEGWVFCNSFNTELSTGTSGDGKPFEAGTAKNDTDFLHVINLKKATEVAAGAGNTETVNGFRVIPLAKSIENGLLHFIPEPKSPHGADVTPNGKYVVVAGKLDPHVTIYSFDKIQKAISAGTSTKDQYGVPVLDLKRTMQAQVELGLGPLHTQFDDKGYAYTSLFLDSAVARWTLGKDSLKTGDKPWTLITKTPVQYNIGHLVAAEGDTVKPDGKYLIAMNKWSIDRFLQTGPLLPQNFQLVDISQTGKNMPVIYDSPIGVAEPHYAQMIKANKLHSFKIYPAVGTDPATMQVDPNAAQPGKERVVRNGNNVEVWMTLVRSHFTPDHVEVNKGDHVTWHLTSVERTTDATHGFAVPGYNINLSLEPGEAQTVEFTADQAGTFAFYCSEFCSALHLEMMGYFLVKG
ncbi:MAG: Sec-dependent nitrous-oxide reductase [Acidimicrobiia bacterium]